MKIIFSDIAIESLQEIIVFLNDRWSAKELQVFHKDLEKLIQSFQDKFISSLL